MHTEAVLQCVTSSGVPGPEHFLVRYKPMPAGPAGPSVPQLRAGSLPTAHSLQQPPLPSSWAQVPRDSARSGPPAAPTALGPQVPGLEAINRLSCQPSVHPLRRPQLGGRP